MPDLSRSNSNRSDASRPRVSFNRDVHVKRINSPRTANAYSLSPDGTTFVPTSVRRERPMTKKEMTKEAEVVLKQVDKITCTATSNIRLEDDKPKEKKKKKEPFLFFKKADRGEKVRNSSSDVDSASSQEYRIYRVNGPPTDANAQANIINKITYDGEKATVKNKRIEKKTYDFMSLDRKRLKNKKKNQVLDYLSLERNNEVFDIMKKERHSNKTPSSLVFNKNDNKSKKNSSATVTEGTLKENLKGKSKVTREVPDDILKYKTQLSPITENTAPFHFEKRRENNLDQIIKKLIEKTQEKPVISTEKTGMTEPDSEIRHNNNFPFSYTNGDTNNLEQKLDSTIVKGLGDGKEDLKTTSPTSDVIYAQVLVGGRDGNVQKTTVNERISSNEVGRIFVGEELNQSQVGLNYKINANQNEGTYERVIDNCEKMWQSDYFNEKKENTVSITPESYGNREVGRESNNRKNSESDRTTPIPVRDEYTRVIKVTPKFNTVKRGDNSPSDLHDLSIRREILLSRSESQAKERFNSLKKLREPTKVRKSISNINGNSLKQSERSTRKDVRYLGDDMRSNEKFETSPRRMPKDVESLEQTFKKKREPKLDVPLKERDDKEREKEEKYKNSDKIHFIKTDDDDNLLRKLSRLGKSKSFTEERPKIKKMEKVKMLFKKKKEEKSSENEDDPLTSRYIEYRGSDVELSDRSLDSSPRRQHKTEATPVENPQSARKIYSTSTPLDTMGKINAIKNEKNNDFCKPTFPNKTAKKERQKNKADFGPKDHLKATNLRFFGDTDPESSTNESNWSNQKLKQAFNRSGKSESDDDQQNVHSRPDSRMTNSSAKGSTPEKSKSKYDLDKPDYGVKQMNYSLNLNPNKFEKLPLNDNDISLKNDDSYDINGLKYRIGVTRSKSSLTNSTKYGMKEKLRNLKSSPAITLASPDEYLTRRVMSHGNLYSQDEGRGIRRRMYDSSAESATEGDSSQNSSKSMIYLHAATVGDIPGPRNIYKSDYQSASKTDLGLMGDNSTTATKKTLSRSISVLAPWRPKHNKEDKTLYYDSVDHNKSKPPTGIGRNKRSSSRERKVNELRFNTLGKESRRRKDLLR